MDFPVSQKYCTKLISNPNDNLSPLNDTLISLLEKHQRETDKTVK